ncbi:MAG: polyphosphate kinase 1 [bacterium]|nr:polyphosphate kinase 1 [bacterium]
MDLRDPQLYINRDISWLKFNERVLQEAKDPQNPLLERVKYLGIFADNLDEFFEVRVSGLLQQLEAGIEEHGPDGMLPEEQLLALSEETHRLVDIQYDCWNNELLPALHQADVHIRTLDSLDGQERTFIQDYCQRELHPVLTPITVNPAHPYPRLINKVLCIAVLLRSHDNETLFGLVQVPRLLPRLIRLPKEDESRRVDYVFLADLVQQHIPELFRGYHILDTAAFRITRNSDLYLDEEEADDLLLAIQSELKNRRKGDTVRLEVDVDASSQIVSRLQKNDNLKDWQIYFAKGPVNLNRLMMLYSDTPRPDLKYQSYQPIEPLQESYSAYFANLRENDIFLHHPYDSFQPVVQFVNAAAVDPKVLAIKQTLYRTTDDSPIIHSLINAADLGKEVTVVVELKARFDEESNIQWARQLQDAGVCVVYGVVGFKTHCKLSLLIRRETDGIRRYAHIGTGNYNPDTARLYTDVGLLTARPDITADVAEVFNLLTTQSSHPAVSKVLVAPFTMLDSLLAKIDREIEHAKAGRPARIVAKMNSLQDDKIIHALYRASQNGVEIDLIVRGICCLRPGVPGVSENIRVRSIVGRYLEHSRIYSFENGGTPEVYIGSADWMPRNLRRRVEILCPVEDPAIVKRIRSEILSVCLADNISARELGPDGMDQMVQPTNGEVRLRAQGVLMARVQGEDIEIPDFFAQAPMSTPASPSSSNGSPPNQPASVRNQKET